MKATRLSVSLSRIHRSHTTHRRRLFHTHALLHPETDHDVATSRRSWLSGIVATLVTCPLPIKAGVTSNGFINENNTQITATVVIEFGSCIDQARSSRPLGGTPYCEEAQSLGKLSIGVYGDRLPKTVSNFLKTVDSGAYDGTVVNRLRQGEFFAIGRQGSRRNGELEAPGDLESNPELAASNAFMLRHFRAGTVSLAIGENDDSAEKTLSSDYHPTQILITTGPGPAPELDRVNVVFGRVVDGFDTLALIAETRTYRPSGRVRSFNALASAIGDERAAEARKAWERPIQPIVIVSAKSLTA